MTYLWTGGDVGTIKLQLHGARALEVARYVDSNSILVVLPGASCHWKSDMEELQEPCEDELAAQGEEVTKMAEGRHEDELAAQ
jgi:hypothetical protein